MTAVAPSFGGPGPRQFDRRCRVEIGGPIKPDDGSLSTHFLDDQTAGASRQKLIVNELRDDIRVKFKMEWQVNNWTPNIGYVEVYGLNDADRLWCTNKNVPVVVFGGYGGSAVTIPPRVGTINVSQVNHKHDGPDWVTKFEGGDGGRAIGGAHASASYAAGTPSANVALDLGKLLGKVGAGSKALIEQKAAGRSFRNGYAVHGKAVREFKSQLADMGLEYTIQNEEIIVFERNGTTQQVFVISPESGLVGSPEFASPPAPGKPPQLKVKTLMNPELRPAAMVILKSAARSGRYRIMTLAHEGDNYGGPWYSDLVLSGIEGSK
jgi:hypothetical protein